MATENEKQLKAHVDELQRQVEGLTNFITQAFMLMNLNSEANSYSHTFYSLQQVDVYVPFYLSPDTIVSVMVEEQPGQYRQVMPVISSNGQNMTINFDRPYTGYVTIQEVSLGSAQLPPPPQFVSMGDVSLYEPALEPIDPQPMTEKTPVGSEDVDRSDLFKLRSNDQNKIVEPKGFGKAMGAIKKWPR